MLQKIWKELKNSVLRIYSFSFFGLKIVCKIFLAQFFEEKKRQEMTQVAIYDYLESFFSNIHMKQTSTNYNKIIWVMWWQGELQMPNIIKACYNSIKANRPAHYQVILITQNNWKEYINLPNVVLTKWEKGIIPIQFFSDIIRFNLLRIHGGVWFDATLLVSQKLSESLFSKDVFTLSIPTSQDFVSNGKWSGFAFGGSNQNISDYIYRCLIYYWENHNSIIDYFLLDYIIKIGYNRHTIFKKQIDNGALLVEDLLILQSKLNQSISPETLNIIHSNIFHKLTYKAINEQSSTIQYILNQFSDNNL